jgi:hypothetical protein
MQLFSLVSLLIIVSMLLIPIRAFQVLVPEQKERVMLHWDRSPQGMQPLMDNPLLLKQIPNLLHGVSLGCTLSAINTTFVWLRVHA